MRKYTKLLKANGVCHCGCGGTIAPVTHRGAKRLYLAGHDPRKKPRPRRSVEARFLAKVSKTETCWLWVGGTSTSGYGRLFYNGRLHNAHRVAYEIYCAPLPDDRNLVVDHICRNRQCVNPQHLQLITQSQNCSKDRSGLCKRGHALYGPMADVRITINNGYAHRICRTCVRIHRREIATQTV